MAVPAPGAHVPAPKSIYDLPYLNSVTLDVYVKDYDIYYDVANVKQNLFFDLNLNGIPLPAPHQLVHIILDPKYNEFVKRIEKYYNRSLTNCPQGI